MNKNLIISIIILILVFLLILGYIKFNNPKFLDNILIFNLYENPENNKYEFDISNQSNQIANARLYSYTNMKGLANEKISPGTRGEFEIILNSSQNMKYQIEFESKNNKPKNLVFSIKDDEKTYNNLEELQEILRGEISENKEKNIHIEWIWRYETTSINDMQDTMDGKSLKTYNFDIKILSYE